MNLHSWLGKTRRATHCELFRRTVQLGGHGPIVSFTFDDFPRSAYHVAGRILQGFGARGTYYVAAGLMNFTNELGELFSREDLVSALNDGHELGSQTFRHSSCRRSSLKDFAADVHQGRQSIEEIAGHHIMNFAYPYGHVTLRSKRSLGPQLTSSRSIIPGFNGPEVDLNLLRANRLYGDLDQMAQVTDLIRENARRKSWLIFYTHDVRPNPSEYGCTPQLFELAASAAARSGARLLTVQQVLRELELAAHGRSFCAVEEPAILSR